MWLPRRTQCPQTLQTGCRFAYFGCGMVHSGALGSSHLGQPSHERCPVSWPVLVRGSSTVVMLLLLIDASCVVAHLWHDACSSVNCVAQQSGIHSGWCLFGQQGGGVEVAVELLDGFGQRPLSVADLAAVALADCPKELLELQRKGERVESFIFWIVFSFWCCRFGWWCR